MIVKERGISAGLRVIWFFSNESFACREMIREELGL